MHFSASFVGTLIIAVACQVSGLNTVIGQYGETLEVPCQKGDTKPEDIFITKWKYDKGDGVYGDLLVKKIGQNVSVTATDEYKDRVSIDENSSLLVAAPTLDDQKTFTCMVVAEADISEYPVHVLIHKAPSGLEITGNAKELDIGKLTTLGQCNALDANPAADITWFKNKKALVADGKGIVITASVKEDLTTGLSSTTSVLQYTAVKEDTDAQFTCGVESTDQLSSPVTFTVIYPTEKVTLQVVSEGPLMEADNVTLKCMADGNPPPTSFNFHIKGDVVTVENADTYILTDVTRDSTGVYKCSLTDNAKIEAAENITINYLDMSLSPSGKVVESAGKSLALTLQTAASGELKVSWTKDNSKLEKEPKFDKLTYSDSGLYECEVSMGALIQRASFELIVQGAPVIKRLTKQRGEDGQHKVLICDVEGSPKPNVAWSINGTSPEETYLNGKTTNKLTIVPTVNLTVSCTVTNELGEDIKFISVSSLFEEVRMDKQDTADDGDQTKVVVGVVIGLLLATVVVGLAYWLYIKKSKQGTWKTGEKEDGSTEESKKLEENSQKPEV